MFALRSKRASTEANKEAAKKRKNDSAAGLAGKHVKVPGRKAMALKAPTTLEGTGATS
jgi:hypothetical protein